MDLKMNKHKVVSAATFKAVGVRASPLKPNFHQLSGVPHFFPA